MTSLSSMTEILVAILVVSQGLPTYGSFGQGSHHCHLHNRWHHYIASVGQCSAHFHTEIGQGNIVGFLNEEFFEIIELTAELSTDSSSKKGIQLSMFTRVLTVFLITVIRAVSLPITAPRQPNAAARFTSELVSCAHRGSWRNKHEQEFQNGFTTHFSIILLATPRLDLIYKSQDTHCSFSHPTGHRNQNHHHTSSQH